MSKHINEHTDLDENPMSYTWTPYTLVVTQHPPREKPKHKLLQRFTITPHDHPDGIIFYVTEYTNSAIEQMARLVERDITFDWRREVFE